MSEMQRNTVSAQWSMEAALKDFEASAISQNPKKIKESSERCHQCLDILLECKQQLFKEYTSRDDIKFS